MAAVSSLSLVHQTSSVHILDSLLLFNDGLNHWRLLLLLLGGILCLRDERLLTVIRVQEEVTLALFVVHARPIFDVVWHQVPRGRVERISLVVLRPRRPVPYLLEWTATLP